MALSLTQSLVVFYLLFCFARMIWAAPFELGLYGALNNWFVARRSHRHLDRDAGPDVGAGRHADDRPVRDARRRLARRLGGGRARRCWSWASCRSGCCWCAGRRISASLPDGSWRRRARRRRRRSRASAAPQACARAPSGCCSLYTVLVYPVQAGVSLHQAPHLIERGLSPRSPRPPVISVFSAMSAVASFGVGFLPRRWPMRYRDGGWPACS